MTDPTTPAPEFDGWVMFDQAERGMLLRTDIVAIDPRAEGGQCYICDELATYELTSREDYTLLCTRHTTDLINNANVGGYVVGALPKD